MKDDSSYGEHSCHDCRANSWCPISNYSTYRNWCSYYIPPNSTLKFPEQHKKALQQIAQERISAGMNPRSWMDD